MAEDAGGKIWVATSRGLLLRVEGDRLIDETARTTGSPNSIRCLSATPDGSLWIGYAGWGVGRLKGGRFARINSERGLFDDYISHIVADGEGWLWFGGDLGIFKVLQREMDDAAADRTARVRSIHYGKNEGLPSLQATFGGAPAALRSRDGRIWIPMRTGLTVIDPERLREHANVPPPPVVLHQVTVDEHLAALNSGVVPDPGIRRNEILDLRRHDGALRLPPGHHRVEFDFTALSLTAPENVHFRYQLSGFDEDWSSPQPRRSATYSLSAGKYEFRVIACNKNVEWLTGYFSCEQRACIGRVERLDHLSSRCNCPGHIFCRRRISCSCESIIGRVQRVRNIDRHSARTGGQNNDSPGQIDRLFDVVADHQDGLGGDAAAGPQLHQLTTQRFGAQHVQGGKRFIQAEQLRFDRHRSGELNFDSARTLVWTWAKAVAGAASWLPEHEATV